MKRNLGRDRPRTGRTWRRGPLLGRRARLRVASRVRFEPRPPMPEPIRVRWRDLPRLDEHARDRAIRDLGAWEATLPAPQQASLRLEALVRILDVYGDELGREWALLGGQADADWAMRELLAALCMQVLSELARRPIRQIVGSIPVGVHFDHARGLRDILIEEMWTEGGALSAVPGSTGSMRE